MKKSILSIVAITVLATSSFAGESSQMLSAGLGTTNYSYADNDFSYSIVDLGYNIGWDEYYININAMLPISEDQGPFFANTVNFKRSQYSVNFAYRLKSIGISIFSGANFAYNTITDQYRNYNDGETGFHVGVAGAIYTWDNIGTFTAKGALSASQMDYADYDTAKNIPVTYTTDGFGYLFGLGLVGSISDNLTYNINLDGYSYYYNNIPEINYLVDRVNFSTTLKAGVGYTF